MPSIQRGIMYDFAVIGGGLIGSATAKHLCGIIADASVSRQGDELSGERTVLVIAPLEPAEACTHFHRTWVQGDCNVYASHYDEGRITRVADDSLTWASLAHASINRYREIEQQSGVGFFTETGYLCVGDSSPDGSDNQSAHRGTYVDRVKRVCDELEFCNYTLLSNAELRSQFPYLSFPSTATALYEAQCAGHISPRKLVEAQLTIASKHPSVTLLRDVHAISTSVAETGDSVAIQLSDATSVTARCVIVAAGAFTSPALLNGCAPPISVHGRTVCLKDVTSLLTPTSDMTKLREMPSIIPDVQFPDAIHPLDDMYLLPPIQYPDGKWYLKMGTGDFEHPLPTLEARRRWFAQSTPHESSRDVEAICEFLHHVQPALQECQCYTANCALTKTKTGFPIIDFVPDCNNRILLAAGGNGAAAKSSDEIGRLVALVATDQWDEVYPRTQFQWSAINHGTDSITC